MQTSSPSETALGAIPHFTFFLGQVEYGLALDQVAEIAPEEDLTRVPGTPDLLCGIVEVRGQPVAVIDLARKFALPAHARTAQRSLVVVHTTGAGSGGLMALVVDRLGGVTDVVDREVEPVPPLSSGIRAEFLRGLVRKGRGFVLLLEVDHVLTASEQEALTGVREAHAPQRGEATTAPAAPGAPAGATMARESRTVLIVGVSGLRCAIDARWIEEVAPVGPMTRVPGAPRGFCGLLNLRGVVVPILDLATRLGQAPFAPRARSRFLIVEPPGGALRGAVGLAVEAVMGMTELDSGDIGAAPAFGSTAPTEFVEGSLLVCGAPTLIVNLSALLAH